MFILLGDFLDSDECEVLQESSICSLILNSNKSAPYFTTVNKNFKNYFNHTSQQQAVYELSKHTKLLSMISSFPSFNQRSNGPLYTNCIQRLTYFLCSLYLPNCGKGFEISQNDCKLVVGKEADQRPVCGEPVIRLNGVYGNTVDWPPVKVDCKSISSSVTTPQG